MDRKPVSVRREDGYFMVDFPVPDGQVVFERIGDTVIGLKFYLQRYRKDFGKCKPEIDSGLDEKEDGILRDALRGLYTFKEHR